MLITKLAKSTMRWWWLAFTVATLVPIVAMGVKPQHYSFYMFYPATPPTFLDRARLAVANGLLVSCCAIAVVTAIRLVAFGLRHRRWAYLALPLIVLFHPLLQLVFLEDLDSYLNYRWRDKVLAARIVGRTEQQVEKLLGRASQKDRFATGARWKYKPLPFYWFGSAGEVFLEGGRVTSFEANDD